MSSSVAFTKFRDGKSSHVFVWHIENFHVTFPIPQANTNSIESPAFSIPLRNGFVRFGMWWDNHWNRNNISCEVHLNSRNSDNFPKEGIQVSLEVKLGCEGNNAYFYETKSDGSKHLKISDHSGWPSLTTLKDLCEGRDIRTLEVHVTVNVFETPLQQSTPSYGFGNSSGVDSAINLEQLLLDPTFSDIVIQCGTETFTAHKAILAWRSEVFKAMLSTNMSESASGRIQMDDMEPKVFQVILRYIYTGKVEETNPDVLLPVIYGAEKYNLDGLKKYCFGELLQCITEELAGPLAVAADLCGAEESLVQTLKGYMELKFYILMKSPHFRELVAKHPAAFF